MKNALLALVALVLVLGTGTAFAAKNSCKYERTKEKGFELAKDARGKSVKGHYLDKFTNQLVVATEWEDISHPVRPRGREMTGIISAASRGEPSAEYSAKIEPGHERFIYLNIEYLRPKKTFPTEDELQNSLSILVGSQLLVGMSDGSVVRLLSIGDVTGETTVKTPKPHSGDDFWLTSKATFVYWLEADAQAALTANDARAVRVITTNGHLDVRIHSGGTGNIRKVINCVSGATT